MSNVAPLRRPPTPAEGGSTVPYAENRAWEVDREILSRRSERRAWWVAGTSMVITLLAIAAVFAQGPLRRVETVAIVVDKNTGASHVETRLSEQTIPAMDALDMHNAAVFVRAREAYAWQWLQRDYDQVARMSTPVVFADYGKQFAEPHDMTKEMGAVGEYRINVVNIRVPPEGRTGNKGEVVVTFEKTKKDPVTLALTTQRFVATIRFEYRPNLLAKEVDRIENPFGYVVTAYRADVDLTGAVKVPS